MEEFALVEADFQQYYHLNIDQECVYREESRKGFLRFARLFDNLPVDSRIMLKLNPVGGWSWSDEVASRTLRKVSEVETAILNTHRKKSTQPMKPDDQFQPDYVKEAKDEYVEWQKEQKARQEDTADMESFWKSMNPNATYL